MSDVKRLLPLAGATCISIVALGIAIPMLPFYVRNAGGTEFEAAVIFSVFSAASLLSSPLWGRLSDRIGRKPVMLSSLFFTIVSYVWLGLADDLWEIFLSRALAGFTAGWLATSQAYVADVTAPENRAKGLGLLGAAFGIGFTIGPTLTWAISAWTGETDYLMLSLIAAGCATVGLLMTIAFVTEPERHRDAVSRPGLKVLGDPQLAGLLGLYFCVFLVFTGVEGVFALWGAAKFGLEAKDIGLLLGFGGIVTALVQGGLVGRLTKKMGEGRLAVLAVWTLAISLILMTQVDEYYMIYFPMAFLAIAMGLHNPAMQSLISRVAPDDWKGGVMGTAQSVASLSRIAGPAWAGAAFTAFGPVSQFYIGAVFLVPVLLGAMIIARRFPAPVRA